MISYHRTLPDGRIEWSYAGWPLKRPTGQRWPSPSLHFWYHHGSGYECPANFHTPDEYIARQAKRDLCPTVNEYDPTFTKS